MGRATVAALAVLDRPEAGREADAGSALRLSVCGAGWTVPVASLRAVAEPGPVTPLPLAPAPVDGLVPVEGRPLLQVDGGLLAGAPAGPRRMLAVLATGAGDIALAVDRIEAWTRDGDRLDLARLLPWTGGLRPVERPSRRAAAPPGHVVGLLLVRSGSQTVALRLDRVERTGRARLLGPLPDEDHAGDRLVLLEDRPVAARPLDGARLPEEPVAILLRGDGGERIALLTEQVLGVERVDAARLVAVDHPGGGRSVWWRREDGPPVRLVDPGPLVGWPPAPPLAAGGVEAARAAAGAGPQELVVEAAGLRIALPLGLAGHVEEEPVAIARRRGGRPVWDAARLLGRPDGGARRLLSLAGGAGLLRVRRVLPLAAGPSTPWQPLPALPPAPAALFDAARWEEGAWALRLRGDLFDHAPPPPLRRPLAAARAGWAP